MAEQAQIIGRVTDQEGQETFAGAKVSINEKSYSTTTDSQGRYRFGNLEPGSYTITVEYLGADSVSQQVQVEDERAYTLDIAIGEDSARLENVLVIGQAAGQAAALNQQRNSDNLVNVVASDAIGQFPDQNVTEALQRVSGISITRDQGEGRFVVVRGMDPNLNAITINGVAVPSAEADARQVALDVIPSDLLEKLEVTKTLRPDMDGDAIGGAVEIKNLSAFDRGGRSVNVRAEASYNDLEAEYSPKLSATYTDIFSVGDGSDNLGIAIAGSWFERDFGSDNLETDGGWVEFDAPDGGEVVLPEEGEQRDYTITRERLGLALNLDYRADDTTLVYLRTLYSDFEDQERRLRNEVKFDEGEITAINGNDYQFQDVEVQKELKSRLETQTITSVVIGAEHQGALWEIDYNAAHSRAKEDEPARIDAVFEGDSNISLTVPGARLYGINGDAAFVDASNYELDEVEFTNNATEDEETSFSINFKRDLVWGENIPGYVKFGAKYRDREKFADQEIAIYDGFGGDFTLADFQGPAVEHPIQPFGPAVDEPGFRDFFLRGLSGFEIDDEDTAVESLGADYTIGEEITAAYIMGKAEIGRWRVLGGVRVEQTDFDARGAQVTIDEENNDGEPVFGVVASSRSYTDVLPGLHLKFEQSDKLIWRAAWTNAVVRPNFSNAAPLQLIEIEEDDGEFERKAEIGNPNLAPLESMNFDFGFEYYPGNIGVFSAGVFYKDIDNFVVLADVAGQAPFTDFDEVIQPVNGDSAELRGIELSWTQKMDFLPAPWDGFLVSANYTYVDSEATLPFRSTKVPLPRQSDNVANLAIGYEKGGLSLRAAVTYRDAYLDSIEDLEDPSFDFIVDDHVQFDLSAKYRINNSTQLYFEAVNINNEPLYAFFGDRNRNAQYESYGWTGQFGVKVFFE